MSGALLLALLWLSPLVALLLLGAGTIIWRQRRAIRQLHAEARHDVLTGLPNRRALAHAWADMPGEKALILIDLVGFKAVNDSHGHIVGDALLQQVATRLSVAVLPPGLIARWGGDEFVALVPAQAAQRHIDTIAATWAKPYDLTSRGGPAEVRIGGRIGKACGETDLETALDTAARGLLEAKAAA